MYFRKDIQVRDINLEKNLPAMKKTWVHSLGWEDPLEKGMATHSSTLAWRIPWTFSIEWRGLAGYSMGPLYHFRTYFWV